MSDYPRKSRSHNHQGSNFQESSRSGASRSGGRMSRLQAINSSRQGDDEVSPRTERGARSRAGASGRRSQQGGGKKGRSGWRKYINLKTVGATLGILFLIGAGVLTYLFMSVQKMGIDKLKAANKSSSVVSAKNGDVIGSIGDRKQQFVSLKDLKARNPMLVETLVKTEDARFYNHGGVDYQGLGRAVYLNILNPGKGGGGGTLAMQLARNIILNNKEKTANRKVAEMKIAWDLIDDPKVGKDGVLEGYLNYIDFGTTIQGVQAASKIYFGKDLTKDTLEPEEVATLIAIPNNPNLYNPLQESRHAKLKERRDWILKNKMTDSEYSPALLTKEKADQAVAKSIESTMVMGENNKYADEFQKKTQHAAYIDYVQKELQERYDINPQRLNSEGYKITVAIDTKMNDIVEQEVNKDANYVNKNTPKKSAKSLKSSFAISDPRTGEIKALSGGRNYKVGMFNYATTRLYPGSSIKPIAAYAPYLDLNKKLNMYSSVNTSQFEYRGWKPKNYSGAPTTSSMQMVDAVKQSDNQAAARIVVEKVTLPNSEKYLNKMGLKVSGETPSALALGSGFKNGGFTAADMTQAYSIFVNEGEAVQAHTVVEVKNMEGKKIPAKDPEGFKVGEEVVSKKAAYNTLLMMKEVAKSKENIKIPNHDVAGKTGTNDDDKSGSFVGFTNDLVAASFVVNDYKYKKTDPEFVPISGSIQPTVLWNSIMSRVMKDMPASKFKRPDGVEEPQPQEEIKGFDFSLSSHGQGVKINIKGGSPNAVYKVERKDASGYVTVVEEGHAGSLVDSSATVDVNDPNQKFTYKVTATVKGDDGENSTKTVEKTLSVSGLKPKPEDPTKCDPTVDPNCIPNPDNGNGGGDNGGGDNGGGGNGGGGNGGGGNGGGGNGGGGNGGGGNGGGGNGGGGNRP
ncbi:transglycosylase domain-containing protein [Thermoactinomyces sp. DSM 45892]|uniref:transglycosylase domain-containing protein n=1 Tax=Thermoactinomyces sp. DSM 45892 TaxID=1882753 RepID=UPI0008972D54|nr:transglycosylase domain-containing protein [Thermoactinomyces sp. DSM 45892]SDY16149.1 penicillin-binding protein 2A [Thermoactinomyces sp. DSM 45892]